MRCKRKNNGFSLLNVLTSIGLIMILLVTLIPLFSASARIQRETGERIQALWILHGVLEDIRIDHITAPVSGDKSVPVEPPVGLVQSVLIHSTRHHLSGLREVRVSASWTTLQGRKVEVSLTELFTAGGGS